MIDEAPWTPPPLAEDLLYFHLQVAQRAGLRMAARNMWDDEYAALYRERENALARARLHYQTLLAQGHQIPPLLAAMVERERGLV